MSIAQSKDDLTILRHNLIAHLSKSEEQANKQTLEDYGALSSEDLKLLLEPVNPLN
jgi:U3 small nucleolar RNA-associated protein 14